MFKKFIPIIFAYLIIGFSFNLVISLVYKRFDKSSFIYMTGDTDGDANLILINILFWPLILSVIVLSLIPFLIKKMYVLFVAIIFSIVALIKKGGKRGRMTREEMRWISVSERLPEDSGEYLVSVVDEEDKNSWYKQVEVAWFAHKKDYDIKESEWRELGIDETVIAWMPLPKAYGEVEE